MLPSAHRTRTGKRFCGRRRTQQTSQLLCTIPSLRHCNVRGAEATRAQRCEGTNAPNPPAACGPNDAAFNEGLAPQITLGMVLALSTGVGNLNYREAVVAALCRHACADIESS
jgi:hypothetical protein